MTGLTRAAASLGLTLMASCVMVARNCLVESAFRKLTRAVRTSGWACRKPKKSVRAFGGSPGRPGRPAAVVAVAAAFVAASCN